jgi:hypothetical protein
VSTTAWPNGLAEPDHGATGGTHACLLAISVVPNSRAAVAIRTLQSRPAAASIQSDPTRIARPPPSAIVAPRARPRRTGRGGRQ